MAFEGLRTFVQLTFKLALALLVWSSVASPRPVHQNAGECELTQHEVQNLVCLQKSIDDDSTTQEIREWVTSRLDRRLCSSVDTDLSVQQQYLLLLHYADQLEAIGHLNFSTRMNQTMELLKETLPQLNTTVEHCLNGSGGGAEEDDITDRLPDLGSSIEESTLPFCYLELIRRLYSNLYQATFNYLPECTTCKRPENLESCAVSELVSNTWSFARTHISLRLSRSCRNSIRQCLIPRNFTVHEHVRLLMEILQNETALPTLAGSDIVPRMSYALSSMNTSLVNVCEECGECSTSNTTLSTVLGSFYEQVSRQNCRLSPHVEEVCLVNLLSTFEALYISMVDDGYFQQCL